VPAVVGEISGTATSKLQQISTIHLKTEKASPICLKFQIAGGSNSVLPRGFHTCRLLEAPHPHVSLKRSNAFSRWHFDWT
jgi:hypothetical protein